MCEPKQITDHPYPAGSTKYANNEPQSAQARIESHMVYELKQKREYLLRQILIVQQAIDAVNLANNFW